MLVEKIYILGALLKLPFFTHDEEMKNWANSYLTFHSWSFSLCCVVVSGFLSGSGWSRMEKTRAAMSPKRITAAPNKNKYLFFNIVILPFIVNG